MPLKMSCKNKPWKGNLFDVLLLLHSQDLTAPEMI